MRVIGITGGIGAGKSRVMAYLTRQPDTAFLEADQLSHILMKKGTSLYHDVVSAFGKAILLPDQEIDRRKLGHLVMEEDATGKSLEQLNRLVHPAVRAYILQDMEARRAENIRFYFLEAALLIQDGYRKICDEIWYVHAPEEIRKKRIMTTRGYSEEKAEGFLTNQPDDEYFRRHSDHVIENTGDFQKTAGQIDSLLEFEQSLC